MQGEEVYPLHRPMKAVKTESVVLYFSEEDALGVIMPHDDALVVMVIVANHSIHRILVDNGSLTDILYWPAFQQMGIEWDRIKLFGSPLVRFSKEQVQSIGIILLLVTARIAPRLSIVMVDFLIVDRPSVYNAIIGRPALNKLIAATLTYYLIMKFPIREGVGEVMGDQLVVRRCYNISMKKVSDPTTLIVVSMSEAKGEPAEPLEEVVVGEGKVLQIRTCLTQETREGLVDFLYRNMEVFTWSHVDMLGISPEEIVHVLNVDPNIKPVKQKRRKFTSERVEVEKLLKSQFLSLTLMHWSTLPLGTSCSVLWMHFLATTRFSCTQKIKRRLCSSLIEAFIAIKSCLSD
jgi:hypothetical protein